MSIAVVASRPDDWLRRWNGARVGTYNSASSILSFVIAIILRSCHVSFRAALPHWQPQDLPILTITDGPSLFESPLLCQLGTLCPLGTILRPLGTMLLTLDRFLFLYCA